MGGQPPYSAAHRFRSGRRPCPEYFPPRGPPRCRYCGRPHSHRPPWHPGHRGLSRLRGRTAAPVTQVWVTVAVVGAATMVIKAAGPLTVGHRKIPPRLLRVVDLLSPALLSALVITQ